MKDSHPDDHELHTDIYVNNKDRKMDSKIDGDGYFLVFKLYNFAKLNKIIVFCFVNPRLY